MPGGFVYTAPASLLGVVRLDFPELGRVRAERADFPPPSPELVARLAGLPSLALLDSASGGRFTLIGAMPLAHLAWSPEGGEIRIPGGARAREEHFTTLLRAALAATSVGSEAPLPMGPGWIGSFGYGLRVAFEEVPERHADDTGIPDVAFAYYPAVAIHDAKKQEWWFVWRTGAEPPPSGRVRGAPAPRVSHEDYLAAVERAVEYIHAGDVFQVNYAHEFRAAFEGHPLALYLALRAANPAPFCAYLDLGSGRAILSTSPELFVRLRGRRVMTRPIKGTRPRGADPAQDRRLADALRSSEKDAAELAMIVDLERNDLGRVCEPGSVVVEHAGRIESFTSVHHRVAEVSGVLEAGADRVDLLAAGFPGGSITGAPKVRAMEIIDELEAGRRGHYSGSIGILTDDGNMDLNIAIRTPLLAGGEVRVHVGGGIVADSDPLAEYHETLDKGRAMFAALGS
jgi:para-aminobenzoate synthetase component 1